MKRVQDPTRLLLLDGQPLPADAPVLPAGLPGVMRGEGIFEAFLVRDGIPTQQLHKHDARLALSASLTGFDVSVGALLDSFEDFRPYLLEGQWRVRLSVLRGLEERQHFLWTAGPATLPPEEVVVQVSDFRVDPASPCAGAKTISRMELQVARARAQAAGAFEAILRTIDGDLAEGTSTNIFLWVDDALHTPPLDRGILGGVTRETVLEGCSLVGIPAFERKIAFRELESAVEVYVTNAVIGLVPVVKIVSREAPLPGADGIHLARLRAAYREALALPFRTPTADS
jgi:branched-subunit amino acid aminotransferase/4-amino-4-deoxychorismate lyase